VALRSRTRFSGADDTLLLDKEGPGEPRMPLLKLALEAEGTVSTEGTILTAGTARKLP
jgi:hypothetical protein